MSDATPTSDLPSGSVTAFQGSDEERVSAVSTALAARDTERLTALVADLKAPDLADILTALEPDERVQLIETLGSAFDYDALSEVDEDVRDQLSEALSNATIAKAVTELDTDDAAYVMESLDASDQKDVLDQVPRTERAALQRNLDYPEETAGRLMQADFVAVPPFWSVGQVIDHMREAQDLPDTFSDIFVVDATHHVLGSVDLSRILRTKRHVAVADVMDKDRQFVLATDDQEEMARQFERYDLKSAPVLDANQRLVGVVTVDDVVEVIEAEADEDIKRLAGVGDESLSDSVKDIASQRFYWLFINLLTAILASMVIKRFDTTIEQMVSLAVLMPIVASMGGNAGTQTMTVAVRALAMHDLTPQKVPRFVIREAAVGLANGLAFAGIMALIAFVWFGSGKLGLVIAAAMVINLVAAACAGVFVPLALERYGFDPAVSSTVFVTTVTDVIGFLAFLGLATIWLV
jgi:magnesium transporter